ncbi:MAG: class I SAM-dependent methyltransferase [Flavobacteriaceae bacterium]|nr:class I SAM-dependent methyltransferase [Flavobacteriaceae bacterium]
MNTNFLYMNPFDEKAKTWDENPVYLERSLAIEKIIRQRIPLHKDQIALDYGAGTGILSFLLKDSLKEITLMDNSIEMVKVMDEKIRAGGVTHFKTLFFDLEKNDYTSKKFDLIYMQMVLHHVQDIKAIIKKFYKMLNAGGSIAIADLYAEDGTFHDPGFSGHLGFDPEELIRNLRNVRI